jgi:hypothetical protein
MARRNRRMSHLNQDGYILASPPDLGITCRARSIHPLACPSCFDDQKAGGSYPGGGKWGEIPSLIGPLTSQSFPLPFLHFPNHPITGPESETPLTILHPFHKTMRAKFSYIALCGGSGCSLTVEGGNVHLDFHHLPRFHYSCTDLDIPSHNPQRY